MRLMQRAVMAVLACAGMIAGCQTVQTTAPGAIGIERKQQMLVSSEQVDQAAAQAYATEVQKAREKSKLNTDGRVVERVHNVAERLIPQTAAFRPDAPGWNWEVNVLSTKELNAYCMPGGKIMVYTGLIDQLKLSDDELSAVIGHEIGHALREHSRERLSRAYAQQIALTGVAVAAGVGQGTLDLANEVATVTFQLPHSREQEAEADRIGLELMARAGYDPHAAVSVWKKMEQASTSAPPEFLSTHPSSQSRIADLEKAMPRVLPLYQTAHR